MRDQIVRAASSATKKAVKLCNLHQLRSLSNFKDDMVPPYHHHLHGILLCHYDCMSTLLHVHFIKPTFIIKTSTKSSTQLQTHNDTHDVFAIRVNILREIFPQVGNCGSATCANVEFETLCVTNSTTFSMLESKRIIVQRTLSCCKEDFPPHRVDRMFLQQLRKCADYDAQENLELDKLNAHVLDHAAIKSSICNFDANTLSHCYKIMQRDEKLILESGQF